MRKPKKLPSEIVSVTYDLEYGTDTLEMHKDAIGNGHRVLIVMKPSVEPERIYLDPMKESEVKELLTKAGRLNCT